MSSVDKQRIVEQAERAANRGDLERAHDLLVAAAKESPDDADLHWHLAIVKEQLDDSEGALRELKNCALLSPQDCRGYRQMAKLMYEQKNFKAAQMLAEEGLSHDSDDRESILILARIARDQHRVDDAKGYYQRALGLPYSTVEMELEVADYYLALNQQEQAGPLLRNIVNHNELPPELLASAWWKLGTMYESVGRWKDSSSAYLNSLALDDERPAEDIERVSLVLANAGEHQQATEVIQLASMKRVQRNIDKANTPVIQQATLEEESSIHTTRQ